MHPDLPFLDLLLRLTVAAGAGIAIGYEREVGDHVAGIRTHTLVAVGSAVFTISGAYGFADVTGAGISDPARVAAQVASGIGFIGAGAIVKDGMIVRGLTTAATLWLSAALGLSAGAGAFWPVIVGVVMVVAVLTGLRLLKPAGRGRSRRPTSLVVEYRPTAGTLSRILEAVAAAEATVDRLALRGGGSLGPDGARTVELVLRHADRPRLGRELEPLSGENGLIRVSLRPASARLRLRLPQVPRRTPARRNRPDRGLKVR
ncbi:MgtC/SapB family protein [Actinomadura sp. WMMA1423]|uniref:MgtC/SapB family protein n=1 Tax=Actinomadura sp. WMMA1423 TaxID=2591108 RepID=UPI001146EE2C|nr:MgtC/SapB family protein [Actinomadura sp. WMMA1423]